MMKCLKKDSVEKRNKAVSEGGYYFAMATAVILAAFLRLFKLTELPFGIHIDEAGLGVNAYSIANFGVDRYLNSYPIYPKNFDGGQSPFYSYLVAFFIKYFRDGELDLLAVRLPMVMVSMLAFLAGLFILKNLMSRKWQIFGAFLYAVLPYFIMQCRFGLDCNALVSMLTISLACLFFAMEKESYFIYVLFGVLWGITYYTYALSYIANTITLLFISAYMLCTKRVNVRKLIVAWLSAFVVAIPLVVMVVVNTFQLPDLMIGKISIFKLENYRGSQIGFQPELLYKNFITILKCIFFKDGINYSSFDGFYTMYVCSIPFFLIGFIYLTVKTFWSVKNKSFEKECIFYFVFLAQFAGGMLLGTEAVPQIHRLNGIFFAQFIIILYGIYALVQGIMNLVKSERRLWKNSLMGLVGAIYFISFLLFARFYFCQYKDAVYPQMLYSDQYRNTIEVLQEKELGDVPTYIDASIVYYQFSTQMNPYDFYNTPGSNMACYKNYFFFLPETGIEKGNVYILRKEDSAHIAEAVDKGLELVLEEGIWRTYY